MRIKYQIEILSDWHCGSGLDSGTDADALVLKDGNGQPYIPGKTIKGLLKDSCIDICEIRTDWNIDLINKFFGFYDEENVTFSGNAFFSNAELSKAESLEVATNKLSSYLYRNISSTAIEPDGIAKQKSLRVTEVCIPLQLEGYIDDVEAGNKQCLIDAFKWTRYLGVGRNRGLGRCIFKLIE